MILTDKEVAKLRQMLREIDEGQSKKKHKTYTATRTRTIRLMLSRAERREKGKLL